MTTTLPHLYSGKVRDLYEVDAGHLMMVASDRLSAFDVIMEEPVPDKGRVLTAVSSFFFDRTLDLVANHVVTVDPAEFPEGSDPAWAGRAMLVYRTTPVRMECIVRGYLFGGAWREYQATGTVNGTPLPPGMQEADRLRTPIFTPSTKADAGHDEPLTRADGEALVGVEMYAELERLALAIYQRAAEYAARKGIILADTKFEFGERNGEILLIDEVCTPDSSRYWPADAWKPGVVPPSYDKQYVRDFLDATGWDHTPPPPALPGEVIAGTQARYVEAYERLTGRAFADWYA
jgi:phosphoribosylaminoimidazole-succinocarboxamide synthase